jgi:hypothetical protein
MVTNRKPVVQAAASLFEAGPKACWRSQGDQHALIAAGQGDVPVIGLLRFRFGACGV